MNNRSLHTLANGARLVVDPMPSLESAALGVWVRAGSAHETADEHGAAHLFEHMAFKGTTSRTAVEIAEAIENVGGYMNASTSHQRTAYYMRVLKDDALLGLELLADIVRQPRLDETDLEKEKEVVVQEIGEAADAPDDVVFDNLQAASWGEHPIGRPILGTAQSVRGQTTGSIRAYLGRNYVPSEIVIAAAGRVDEDALVKSAGALFGDWSAAGDARAESRAPAFIGDRRQDARSIEQTHVAFAFPGAASVDDDFFATRVFADALGGGMSSRLFQEIRENRGLAYSVYAFADGYDDCGLVGAYAGADHDEVGEIAAVLRAEMEGLADAPRQDELDRARAMLRSSILMGLENPAARAEAAAGQLIVHGRLFSVEEMNARLDAVSIDDIRRCAARALEGPFSLSIVGRSDPEAAARAFV